MALGIEDKEKKPGGLQPSGPNQLQAGPTPLSQPPQKKATGFVNLNKYMQANVGNKLGQAVGGGISGQAGQARTGLQQQQGQFQQQAQQGRVGTAQDVNQMQSVLQDPTQATDQDVAAFQKFRTQGYTGPQGLQNEDQLRSQAQQSQQMGQAIGSTGGRLGLLQRFLGGGGQYGAGQQKMDEMLLGRGAGQQLREARRSTTGVSSELQSGLGTAQNLAQQYGKEAEEFKGQVGRELGAKETGVTDVLGNRITEETRKKEDLGKSLGSDLRNQDILAEQAKMLGLDEGLQTYGVDLSKYLKAGETPATMQNVASSEEMAKMNALARLGGKQAFGKDEEAGSFMKNQYSLDRDTMDKAIAANKESYESQAKGVESGKQAALSRAMGALGYGMASTGFGAGDAARQAAGLTPAAIENALKSGNLGSIGVNTKWGYNMYKDAASGGGGGYDAQLAYQEQQRIEDMLKKQYSPEQKVKFRGLQSMMNPSVKTMGTP